MAPIVGPARRASPVARTVVCQGTSYLVAKGAAPATTASRAACRGSAGSGSGAALRRGSTTVGSVIAAGATSDRAKEGRRARSCGHASTSVSRPLARTSTLVGRGGSRGSRPRPVAPTPPNASRGPLAAPRCGVAAPPSGIEARVRVATSDTGTHGCRRMVRKRAATDAPSVGGATSKALAVRLAA